MHKNKLIVGLSILLVFILVIYINPLENEKNVDNEVIHTIKVPYGFSGDLKYKDYSEVEEEIHQFDHVTEIGKDESGNYDMHMIELGNREKPSILITAGMHGSEWQGTLYSLQFMEDLRDGTFPDEEFRERLLSEYHIIYIPVVNPYGFDRAIPYQLNSGRYNSNGEDLNRDFYNFTQAESQNVKVVMDIFKPFAYLDIHMMQSQYSANGGNNIVLGNGQKQTDKYFDYIAESIRSYADQPLTKWGAPAYENPINPGLSRTYMRNQTNPYTPYTLSYIFELAKQVDRDTGFDAPLSDQQIIDYGMAGLYLFLYTSAMYFEDEN
ncbi:DUF2817 domain-containing protein [Oceanobacillus sp. J11TS1]|uniref:DUF2817 domain-containing protein n=1 Tax=Oceanobacillus sp. J11TS1 TaxID=2807191 RepID=UPI001B03BE7F|nr:DUF2817 domain-containing protein [Oceanobacillus sp. J11TS1]GIO23437.1 hypothetical protein J11TS1_20180 [Oceanobacillus sp. J11TS1]